MGTFFVAHSHRPVCASIPRGLQVNVPAMACNPLVDIMQALGVLKRRHFANQHRNDAPEVQLQRSAPYEPHPVAQQFSGARC